MVTITVFIEGVGYPNPNPAADTVDNSAVFRKSFHQLFSQVLTAPIDLEIEPGGPNRQAIIFYKRSVGKGETARLLIDLDADLTHKAARITEFDLSGHEATCFFMVQEMEAWLLSQPEKIDLYATESGFKRARPEESIANNNLIRNMHPEQIVKPSEKLNTIFRQYFKIEKKNRPKPKSYSKTKDGSAMIAYLDMNHLMQTFEDARNLIGSISNTTDQP